MFAQHRLHPHETDSEFSINYLKNVLIYWFCQILLFVNSWKLAHLDCWCSPWVLLLARRWKQNSVKEEKIKPQLLTIKTSVLLFRKPYNVFTKINVTSTCTVCIPESCFPLFYFFHFVLQLYFVFLIFLKLLLDNSIAFLFPLFFFSSPRPNNWKLVSLTGSWPTIAQKHTLVKLPFDLLCSYPSLIYRMIGQPLHSYICQCIHLP